MTMNKSDVSILTQTVTNHQPIPLEKLCSLEVRELLEQGTPKGSGHNHSAIKVAKEVIGVESYCQAAGIPYQGTARELYESFLLASGIDSDSTTESRWKSAIAANPSPSLSDDKFENCLKAWNRQNGQNNQRVSLTHPQSPKKSKQSATLPPIEGPVKLARFDVSPSDYPQSTKLTETKKHPKEAPQGATVTNKTYHYSPTQFIKRFDWEDKTKPKGRDKTFRQYCINQAGEETLGKGNDHWPAYRENEAIAAKDWVLFVEGEDTTDTARCELGLVATTFQGSNWSEDAIAPILTRFKDAGCPGIVIIPDHDKTGEEKGQKLLTVATKIGLQALIVPMTDLWIDCPEKGDLTDWIKWVVNQGGMIQNYCIERLEKAIEKAINYRLIKEPDTLPENECNDDLIAQNKWNPLSEHNYEMGKFEDGKMFFADNQEEEAQEFIKNNPNCILVNAEGKVTNEDGEIQKAKGKKVLKFNPLSDFTFSVERILHSEKGGGFVLRIERVIKGRLHTQRVTVNTESFQKVPDFILAVSKGLKNGVIYNGDIRDLKNTLKVKTNDYYQKGGVAYRLTDRIGCQEDGTWVFKNIQFTKEGKVTDESATKWVSNDQLSEDDHIPCPTILEPDPEALPRLVDAIRRFSGDSFYRILLVLGFAAAAAQYKEIIEKEKCFPVMNLYGDPGSLKTIAAECAMSLFGWHKDGALSHSSESALYERLKFSGSLLNCLDDPTRDEKTEEILKRLYNAKPRVVRGNSQQPHSPILVSSNHVYGDNSQATRTRLSLLYFPKVAVDRSVFSELQNAKDKASGALSYIIGLGYPKNEIDNLESELVNYVPLAHARIAKSLAILTYYTSQVVRLAGLEIDIKKWVIDNLCNTENDKENNKDSLTDFMEKTQILFSKSELGEWNVKTVTSGGRTYTAMVLNEVWAAVDRAFSPAYSIGIIKALAKEAGSIDQSTQKFNADRDTTLAWKRNELSGVNAEKPPTKSKKCWLIPIELSSDPDYDPPVTSVTSQLPPSYKKGNQQNPCPVSDSADNTPSVTLVTFFNEDNQKEESQITDLLPDSKSENETSEKSDFSTEKGNRGNQSLKPLPSNGYTPVTSEVTEGNRGNQKDIWDDDYEVSDNQKTNNFKAGDHNRYDWNEVIAGIDSEMGRLGWGVEDGQAHLMRVYGVRSRHLLKDEQVIEFWEYLKAQCLTAIA